MGGEGIRITDTTKNQSVGINLHRLATDAEARETMVFTGTVKGITEHGAFIAFGAARDGLLRRTTVKRFDTGSNKLVDAPLKLRQKVRVMVTYVVLHKDVRKVRIGLRVAQKCNLCDGWGHRASQCDFTRRCVAKTCGPCAVPARAAKKKSSVPDTRTLEVAVVGKEAPKPPAAPASQAKGKAWAGIAVEEDQPEPESEPEPAVRTATPVKKEEACAAALAPRGKSRSAKRRARKAAVKAKHETKAAPTTLTASPKTARGYVHFDNPLGQGLCFQPAPM